jgi:hypothetical protein
LHYDATPGVVVGRGGGADGAVPHRTYQSLPSPWVPPGVYQVRLNAGGQVSTRSITVKLDPRVRLTPQIQQLFLLTSQIEADAAIATAAHREAIARIAKLSAEGGHDALLKSLHELAPDEKVALPAAGGFGPSAEPSPGEGNLTNIASHLVASVMPMQASELPPTAAQLEACKRQIVEYRTVMAKWNALRVIKQ